MESGVTFSATDGVPANWLADLGRRAWAHRVALALVTIVVAGGALRLWGLASKSLWIDETFTVGMASQPWPQFWHTVLGVQPNMELFYVLMRTLVWATPAAWQRGEFFWRLLPALAGTATIAAVFPLARRLFGSQAALAAAAGVAVNEFLVEYAQQARGYTLFVLVLTLSYLALVRWLEGDRRALWWFGALAALGFLTQAFEVVFLTGQLALLALAALRGRRVDWRGLRLALLPCAAVIGLRLPVYGAHPDQVSWIPRPTLGDLVRGARQLAGGDGGVPSRAGDLLLLATIAALGVLVVWAVGPPRDRARWLTRATADERLDRVEQAALVVLWLAVPVLGTWLGSQVKPVWVTRYLAPASVAACLALGAAVAIVSRLAQRPDARRLILTVLTAGTLALAAIPLRDYLARPGWEDWRGAAAFVNARYQTGDGVVCYDNQWGCDFGFGQYFAAFGGPARLDPAAPGAFSWPTYAQPDREAIFAQAVSPAALAPYLAAKGRVWVLLGHFSNGQGDPRAALAWLDAHATRVASFIAAGDIEVYCYATPTEGNPTDVHHQPQP